MLLITNDGRKLALDQRLLNPILPDSDTSKINLFLRFCIGVMDIGYFFSWYALGNQFVPQVVIHTPSPRPSITISP